MNSISEEYITGIHKIEIHKTEIWYKNKFDIVTINKSFIKACKYNNLEIAKWLNIIFCLDNVNFMDGFWYACCNNHLELAKWIISVKKININSFINYSFFVPLSNLKEAMPAVNRQVHAMPFPKENKDIANLLYSLKNIKIDNNKINNDIDYKYEVSLKLTINTILDGK
jgi:hypothetical protein